METNLERFGVLIANGKLLQTYDEHSEDESITGNTDRADNLLTLAEFRDANDCIRAAELLNTCLGKSV